MITISSSVLDFGEVCKSKSVTKQVTVFNIASINATIVISSTSPDFVVAPEQFVLEPYTSKTFTVQYTANNIVNNSGQIIVSSNISADVICEVSAIMKVPSINISTNSINFGQIGINDSKTISLNIENTSTDAIAIINASISTYSSNFSCPSQIEISPLETKQFNITFTIENAAVLNTNLTLLINDEIGTYTISLTGQGVYATYMLSSTVIDFATNTAVNNESIMNVTLTNTHSDARLLINSLQSSDSYVFVTADSNVIEPGSTSNITLIFKPASPQPVNSTVQFFANTSNQIIINVTGTGILAPKLIANKSVLNFGTYLVNQNHQQTITLSNTGIIDLLITSVTLPNTTYTTVSLLQSLPLIIPALSSITIDIILNSTNNDSISSQINVVSNSIDPIYSISILGEAKSPEIYVDVDELDFGTVYVNSPKTIQFTISNLQNVDLNISILNSPHVSVSLTNTTVTANSSIILQATFNLNTVGEINENLVINSNDVLKPSVNLQIHGKAIKLDSESQLPISDNNDGVNFFYVIPEFVIINYMSKAVPNIVELTIINRSFTTAAIDSFTFTNLGDALISISSNDLPFSLEPGESKVITFEFISQSSGNLSGYLKFNARVGNSLEEEIYTTIRYQGNSFAPDIEISTTSLTFPNTAVGETQYESFVIANNSVSAELSVSLISDNELFHFKEKSIVNLTASNSKILLSDKNIVLQSVSVIDNLSGQNLILGDPVNTNQFSVNTGSGVITVNSSLNGHLFQIQYDYKQTEISLIIGRQSSKNIDIGFSPKNTVTESGIITITSNDVDNPVLNVNVQGLGLTAITSIIQDKPLHTFEAKINNPIIQLCVLKNTGTVKLFVSNISSSSTKFFIHQQVQELFDSGIGFEIDPNETYNLPIVFNPTDDSEISANLIIDSNASDLVVPVNGRGLKPILSVPSVIDFSTSAINIEKKISLIVSNNGTAQMNVQLDLVSDFFFLSPSVFAVEPESTYESIISFKPKEIISYTAKIKITSDDPENKEKIIDLTGTGALKPVIEVISKLEFPKTNVRETTQLTLVVTNSGSESLAISSLSVTDNPREFNVSFAPTSIQPLTSRNYVIKFIPSKAGLTEGKIKIISNDTDKSLVEILLKGEGFQPKGEWQSFNLQDLMPDPIMSLANGVDNFVSPVKTILTLIKSILNLVKIFLVDSNSALATVLKKVQSIINDYVSDLSSTGIYILPIYPRSNYYDPNVIADSGFSKYLASIGGGSVAFKKRIIDSFNDIYDGNRPQFSPSAKVGAFIIAVDSGNLVDVISGIRALQNIFSATTFEPEIQAPSNVNAIGDDTKMTLRWQLPEFITFNVMGLFNQRKVIEFIDGFNIYRSEQSGQLTIATEDNHEKKIKKGDVIDFSGNVVKPINGDTPVKSNNYSYLFKNFIGRGSSTVQSLGFDYTDTGLTNNKTYYYVVRTVMSGSSSPMSPLSNEAAGMPQKIDPLETDSFLNRCANFNCFLSQSLIQSVNILTVPVVKLFDKTGLIQQTNSRTEKDKIIPNAGIQQVNTFTITIRDTKIDSSSILIRNVTVAKDRITSNKLDINVGRFYDESSKKILDWDNSKTDFNEEKKNYFEELNNTKLFLGYDFTVVKDRDNTIITINDISNIGYKQSDHIIIEYIQRIYLPSCLFFSTTNESGQFDNRFDATKCLNGTNKGICEKYINKCCAYHNGTGCSNTGYTYKGENRCVQNSVLFDSTFCQNGSMSGTVNYLDRSLRNDPNSCIKTTGVCGGYTSIDEQITGMYPNWTSFSIKALIRPIENFIESLNQWVNREIDAIQKGSSTVADFIDLLSKKIEALEEFIDKLQEIINIFQSIFSANAGFHILKIEGDSGGVERIKSVITSAKGGPNSGSNGFTAGIVILVGGPDFEKTWQFLKQLF
jgi:hypothetical protein